MTKAYLVLKTLDGTQSVKNPHAAQLIAEAGHQLIMSVESATEMEADQLVKTGHLKLMTDAEALAHQRSN